MAVMGPAPAAQNSGPKLAVPLNPNALASGTQAPQGHNAKHGLLPHGADQGLHGLFED